MAKEYSPDVVAQSFIKQFYEMLAENPSELHRFYMEDSFFTHCEGQQTTPAVQGVEAIRQKVSELHLAGARVDLSEGSVDAQRSDINGVFVVVTGEFTQPSRSLDPKRFVQTFFLASQAPTGQAASMASYFVRNSVFRLLNGPSTSTTSVSVSVQAGMAAPLAMDASTATGNTSTSSASTSTAEQEVHHLAVPVAAPAPAPAVVAVAPVPAEVLVNTSEAPGAEASIPPIAEPVLTIASQSVASVVEPSVPSAPRSYSDMARAAASQTPASPARFTSRPVSARPSASALKAQEFTAAKPTVAAAGPSLSLYVKQVPEAATEGDVLALFGRFGVVKRVELNGQRGFAFVDYDNAASVQACLVATKEAAISLHGAALKVEERNSRGGGGPGGNSSGGRNKSGVRREGENRDRRDGGGAGRGSGREGGDRDRRDRDRKGSKPEVSASANGASSGAKTAAPVNETNGVRLSKK